MVGCSSVEPGAAGEVRGGGNAGGAVGGAGFPLPGVSATLFEVALKVNT